MTPNLRNDAAFRGFCLALVIVPLTFAAHGRQVSKESGGRAADSMRRNLQSAHDLIKQNDYPAARDLLETVIRSKADCGAEVYIMLATCRLHLNEGDEAIQTCERALDLYPALPRLQKLYVSVLRATRDRGERKRKLARILQRDPNSTVYMMASSEILLAEDAVGLQAEIEPLVRKAALALPLDPEAHYLYGQWACLNDKQELSIRELTKALALTRDNDQAKMQTYTYLGIAHERLHQPASAERAYRNAIALNRSLPSPVPGTHMQYAKFLQDEQREAEAQEVISQILEFAPSFGLAHLERAKFLAEHEKMQEALAEGELALKYAGTDVIRQRAAHAFLARACYALGRTEDAKLHQKWIESHWRR